MAGLIALFAAAPADAQPGAPRPAPTVSRAAAPGSSDSLAGFADRAELALASPVIARATIAAVRSVPLKAAIGAPAGRVRLLVTADVINVLTAPAAVPPRLTFLWDAPADARGRAPAAKGRDVLLFLAPPAANGATRLMSRRGVQPWGDALADAVRGVLRAAKGGDVPMITGVDRGFHAEGTVAGESESQYFLATADGRPAVLVVQNRPREAVRVTLAQGEIIDDSAQAIAPGTLTWYQLACVLPRALPAAAGSADAMLARDWQAALASLGPCDRTN
jgi:hypothetical protein